MKSMLAVDVGNSNVKFGYFQNGNLTRTWKFPTVEIADATKSLLKEIDAPLVVSSVVPDADRVLFDIAELLQRDVKRISAAKQTVLSDMSPEMGTDRVAEAVAAWRSHGQMQRDVIALGFGTANTLLAVTSAGRVVGGWIAPGLSITLEVLHERCRLLPLLTMTNASDAIGHDTETHMRNGVFLAHLGLAKQWIVSATKALNNQQAPLVIATGGGAAPLQALEPVFDIVDENLTLQGIYLLSQNQQCLT